MKVLVFGQGKTGTTVLAKTIQHSIPGARFLMEPRPRQLRAFLTRNLVVKVLYGQWKSDLTALTSLLRNESRIHFDKLITIIRDPRDQAISFLLYNVYDMALASSASDEQLRRLIQLIQSKESDPASISFSGLCDEINRLLGWNGFTSTWLLRDSGLVANASYWSWLRSAASWGFLLRYEDFMQNRTAVMEDYLGVKLCPDRSVDEFARTRRSASWGNWRRFFTPEDVVILRPAISPLLDEMGYPDWDLDPVDHLDPEQFSGYMLTLVREVRGATWG